MSFVNRLSKNLKTVEKECEDLVASPAVQDSETAQGGAEECKIGGHFSGWFQFSRNCLGMQNWRIFFRLVSIF